jgi:hypothetical protein
MNSKIDYPLGATFGNEESFGNIPKKPAAKQLRSMFKSGKAQKKGESSFYIHPEKNIENNQVYGSSLY